MTADGRTLPSRLLPLPTLYQQAVVTVLLAGWADWLFFGHGIGISFAIFMAALGVGAVLVNHNQVATNQLVIACLVLVISLVPSIENLSYLSAGLGIAGIISFVLIARRQFRESVISGLVTAGAFVLRMPVRLPFDAYSVFKADKRRNAAIKSRSSLSVWVLPIGFSLIFLALFFNANPLIEKWLTSIDLSELTESFNGYRVMFWCATLVLCWPFVRFRPIRKFVGLPTTPTAKAINRETKHHDVFGEPAIFRSLVLFNLLFGLQIGLDSTYLLGGADLPDGMTYAQYAHRGAYPLICTALLAAAFVLFATRPGSRSEHSARVRSLILAWTVQNVALALFSIQRLGLYVDNYALTYWRFAAFIWMVLVLIGLLLIVTKFACAKSNTWLIEMNFAALACVLYVTSLVNVPSIIAQYNFATDRLDKPALDFRYLLELGPDAAPTIDQVVADYQRFGLNRVMGGQVPSARYLADRRNMMAIGVSSDAARWRMWSFRRYRLQRYLDSAGPTGLPSSTSYLAR